MKLSDIHGEQSYDVLAKVTPPIMRMAGDKRLVDALSFTPEGDDRSDYEKAADKASAILPIMLNDHRQEVNEILAAINGVTVDEFLNSLNPLMLATYVFELIADPGFTGFLGSGTISRGSSTDA